MEGMNFVYKKVIIIKIIKLSYLNITIKGCESGCYRKEKEIKTTSPLSGLKIKY
jgi:hypothetical protein